MKNASSDVEELMNMYATPLLRYAERLVRNPQTAQDVVQQVFVKYASLPSERLPGPDTSRAWLYRVTHHQAVDVIRSEQRRRKLYEAHAESLETSSRTPSEKERKQRVLDHLHLLGEKEKQVLLLRLEEGLSYREISEVTGLKEGHIGFLLHQAVRRLSSHFKPGGEPS